MKTAYDFFHSKEQWGNTSDGYEDFSTSDMVRFAEEYATQAKGGSGKDREDMTDILKQFGEFMWNCSDDENDHDLAIGYDDHGMANSVSLIIHGRTHSEFKLSTPPVTPQYEKHQDESGGIYYCIACLAMFEEECSCEINNK